MAIEKPTEQSIYHQVKAVMKSLNIDRKPNWAKNWI